MVDLERQVEGQREPGPRRRPARAVWIPVLLLGLPALAAVPVMWEVLSPGVSHDREQAVNACKESVRARLAPASAATFLDVEIAPDREGKGWAVSGLVDAGRDGTRTRTTWSCTVTMSGGAVKAISEVDRRP